MADDARLIAVVEANTKAFENAMKRLEGVTKNSTDRMTASVKKMDASFASVGKRLDSVGKSLAGFVSVGAIQQVIKETVAWGDALGDLADQTGLTTKQIQVLRYAAKQTGSSADQMDTSLKKFGVTLAEARTKGNDLKKILDANGISLTDMAGKARPASDVLNDVIDLIGRLGDEQQKTAVITAAFGAKNGELLTTFRNGLGPIEAWAKALGQSGIVTDDVVNKLGELDQKFNDVMTHISAIAANAVSNMRLDLVLDYVSRTVDELNDLMIVANMLQKGEFAKALEFATTRGARRQQKAISDRIDQTFDLPGVSPLKVTVHPKPAVVPPLGGGGSGGGGGGGRPKPAGAEMTTVTSSGGLKFTVDARYADQFQGLLDDLDAAGIPITTGSSFRKNATVGRTGRPSQHRYGKAIDVNPALWKQAPESDPSRMMGNPPVELLRTIAARWGMRWGGDFNRRDPMHFDVMGKAPMGEETLNTAKGLSNEAQTLAENTQKAAEAAKSYDDAAKSAQDAIMAANAAFKRDLVGGFIRDLEHGVKPAEALANALQKISDRLLDMALNAIFPDVGGGILGAVFAGGGVMTGRGPMPLRRYAGGGVAHSPQVALFGEGGRPEAYVPLPDGRRIPVNIRVPGMGGLGGGHGGQAVAVHSKVSVEASPLLLVTTANVATQAGHSAVIQAGDNARRRPGGR